MKGIYLFALAAISVLTLSCSKENNNDPKENVFITVTIPSLTQASSKAVGAPGATTTPTIENGFIFIVDKDGNSTIYKESLTVKGGAAQVIKKTFPSDVKVLVVANLPESILTAWSDKLPTVDDIKAQTIDLDPLKGGISVDYKTATLMNQELAKAVSTGDKKATATVAIAPVYSRIELGKVTSKVTSGADDYVASFTVAGVYVVDAYDKFTLGGLYAGSISMSETIHTDPENFPTYLKDMVECDAITGSASPKTLGDVWGYNVPAAVENVPARFIIKLTNVTGLKGGAALKAEQYLIVKRLTRTETVDGIPTTTAISKLETGKIYKISDLQFDSSSLSDVPNVDNTTVDASVTVTGWETINIDGNL